MRLEHRSFGKVHQCWNHSLMTLGGLYMAELPVVRDASEQH